jgi:hypothetical protein
VKRQALICFVLVLSSRGATSHNALTKAASKYIPGVTWQVNSTVTGDFTCSGHKQTAILGTTASDVVLAVFLSGINRKPEELRFNIFRPELAQLTTEDLDYELDYELPGFRRSKSCMGLNVDDREVDPAHLYWNHDSNRFGMWRL